jgi:UDP-N-acetylglucosamine pyrophosphorylase
MSSPRKDKETAAVVLAAGKGTRMRSDLPKVAVPLMGKAMILHVLESLVQARVRRVVIIVGYKKEEIISLIPEFPGVTIEYAEQKEQLGTAHALLCAKETLKGYQGPLVVACGDMPLIRSSTFASLLNLHEERGFSATVLSARQENPTGYGRLVRDEKGELERIVEEKDATDEIRTIQETNSGTYIFNAPDIFSVLSTIGSTNAQNEYYLPDAIEVFRKNGKGVGSLILEDPLEAMGANSKEDILMLEQKLSDRVGTR